MNCSPVDLKDYFFGELNQARREEVRAHLESCAKCREEMDRLGVMHNALCAVPGEEPPRRISFVSDRVFEPRWWQVWWNSAPRLGFASAMVLAASIVVHGALMRPQAAQPQQPVMAQVDASVVESKVQAEVSRRLDQAVAAAVAESEARQAKKTDAMVESVKRDIEDKRQADRVAFSETLTVMQKRYNAVLVASNDLTGGDR